MFLNKLIKLAPFPALLLAPLKTVEAERISVDHVAHLKPSDGGSAATQCECLFIEASFHYGFILFNKPTFEEGKQF